MPFWKRSSTIYIYIVYYSPHLTSRHSAFLQKLLVVVANHHRMPVHASKGRSKQRPESRFAKAFQEGRSRTEARRARNGGRQPWVTRKMAVGIAIALICYTVSSTAFVTRSSSTCGLMMQFQYYVYVATHCVPMIKREASALGGRSLGSKQLLTTIVLFVVHLTFYIVALLVVFNVLWLMFVWSYGTVRHLCMRLLYVVTKL